MFKSVAGRFRTKHSTLIVLWLGLCLCFDLVGVFYCQVNPQTKSTVSAWSAVQVSIGCLCFRFARNAVCVFAFLLFQIYDANCECVDLMTRCVFVCLVTLNLEDPQRELFLDAVKKLVVQKYKTQTNTTTQSTEQNKINAKQTKNEQNNTNNKTNNHSGMLVDERGGGAGKGGRRMSFMPVILSIFVFSPLFGLLST